MWYRVFATSAVVMLLLILACQIEGDTDRYPDWLKGILGLIVIVDSITLVVSMFASIWV